MASYNRVVLMGHLTSDPSSRQVGETTVCDIGVAVNERFKNREGEWQEQAVFVDVVAWGRQAETCAEYLRKGSPVLVEGRLQLDHWQTRDGGMRSKLRVRADRVQFLGAKGGGDDD